MLNEQLNEYNEYYKSSLKFITGTKLNRSIYRNLRIFSFA